MRDEGSRRWQGFRDYSMNVGSCSPASPMSGPVRPKTSRRRLNPAMRSHSWSRPFILQPLSFILLCLLAMFSRPLPAGEHELKLRMQKKVYHNAAGKTLSYRIYVPRNYDSRDKYPLILFLHGIDGRGQDNESQLRHPEVLRLISDSVQVRYPCFLVAPQCPKDEKWVDVPWGSATSRPTPAEPTPALRRVTELLCALDQQFSSDPARHYATGIAMGAFGAVELCLRRPAYWAAAFPVCGGGDG